MALSSPQYNTDTLIYFCQALGWTVESISPTWPHSIMITPCDSPSQLRGYLPTIRYEHQAASVEFPPVLCPEKDLDQYLNVMPRVKAILNILYSDHFYAAYPPESSSK